MKDIANTNYITINNDGVFVGGEPATTYNGKEIGFIDNTRVCFSDIQMQNPEVQELHVGAFETNGRFMKAGNPSEVFGKNAWARVKLWDGRLGPWVFNMQYNTSSDCAFYCAQRCCNNVRLYSAMRSAMLKIASKDKQR